MEIALLTIISLGISYLTIYCVVYFLYIYLFKDNESISTLFQPKISILIPAHNEADNISKSIESIINQDYEGFIEIIVLDDGSTDKTQVVAKKYPVKYCRLAPKGKPQGKTKTINQGIKIANSEIIGVLDADSYIDNKAINNMVGEFENPETGAVVPIVKVHEPRNLIERMQSIEYTLSMCVRKLASTTGSLFMTHGVCTLFRKKALKKAGLFEENTLTEDLNIALKLIKKGYKIKSKFNAIGYTIVPRKTKGVVKQRLRWNGGLFENSYWFRDLLFNKKQGNLGMFIMPMNLAWSGLTVYVATQWVKDSIKGAYYDFRDLLLTNFDWNYFIINKINSLKNIHLNELTILSIVSVIMFASFYLLISKKIKMKPKEIIISYILLPIYFSVFFLINATVILLTPLYMIKKGGKPWLTEKTS